MKVFYAGEDFAFKYGDSIIFLVGPSPRDKKVKSWRPEAISYLKKHNFDGIVLNPERKDNKFDYINQVEWERKGLEAASNNGCIAAWVPRDLEKLPGFTTNVEFGYYVKSNNFIYGRPDESPKNRYLDWLYKEETGVDPSNDLEQLMKQAIGHSKSLWEIKRFSL